MSFTRMSFNYEERFVIGFVFNQARTHNLEMAKLYRTLTGLGMFEGLSTFGASQEVLGQGAVSISLYDAPDLPAQLAEMIERFFNKFGFPAPVGQEALSLLDRLQGMQGQEIEVPQGPEIDQDEFEVHSHVEPEEGA